VRASKHAKPAYGIVKRFDAFFDLQTENNQNFFKEEMLLVNIMGLININGINLNINSKGQGDPLLLIHGVGGDHTQLNNVINHLSQNFKVIAPDCRGHGKSDKPDRYTLADHIADFLGIMDHYGIQTVFINGISMGSYIAQGIAITAPERVSKLILTVTKSNGITTSVQKLFTDHAKELEGLNQHESHEKTHRYL
jgi:3-oxoadipate enol-lactonase